MTFKDLEELQRRGGFCTKVCRRMYESRGRAPRSPDTAGPVQTHASIMTNVKRGARPDLGGVHFRSRHEANVARFFNFCGISWTYEPRKYVFTGYSTAPVCYTPDFEVQDRNRLWLVEVKGYWLGSDRQKLRRLKAQHPDAFSRLWVITSWSKGEKGARELSLLRKISTGIRITDYRELRKLSPVIHNWET